MLTPSGNAAGQPLGIGHTQQRRVVGKNPAAGANYSLTLGPLFWHRLIGSVFQIDTDSNAANRLVTIEHIQQDAIPFNLGGAGLVLTASTTAQRYCGSMYRGVAEWAANTDVYHPILPVWLPPATQLQINLSNIQAGDTITKIVWWFDVISQSADQRVATADQVT